MENEQSYRGQWHLCWQTPGAPMNMRWFIASISVLPIAAQSWAGEREGLKSPSQVVRDAAAAQLRATGKPPPRARWEEVIAPIKNGDTKESIDKLLRPLVLNIYPGPESRGISYEWYQLDEFWALECCFREDGNVLIAHTLKERVIRIWVEPVAEFSGTLVTYFANGQKSHEIEFEEGLYHGVLTRYHSNGAPSVVQKYVKGIVEGDDFGFYASGKIMYQGRHEGGKPVGTWTWYNEDGTVQKTQDHPKPTGNAAKR